MQNSFRPPDHRQLQQMDGHTQQYYPGMATPEDNFTPPMPSPRNTSMSMRNMELPAGNTNQATYSRPVNGYVNVNKSQRSPNSNYNNIVNASPNPGPMPCAHRESQPTPTGGGRPNNTYQMQTHPQWFMADNSPYQNSYAPGRVGANTPRVPRGQAPFNPPCPQGYPGLPQQAMPPGPHENQRPNRRMPQYDQSPSAQRSADVPWDMIQQGKYRQAVPTGDQATREPHLNMTRTRPQPNTTPAGTSRQVPNAAFPGRSNIYTQQDNSVNAGARRPVLTAESGSVATQQPIDTRDEKDFRSGARVTRLSAAVKEGVEKAFENGLLEGQGVVFSSFEKEFRKSHTIFGVTATLPRNKTLDEVIKNVQDHLTALFVPCRAEVSKHGGVKLTRQWLEKSINNGKQEAPTAYPAEETLRTNNSAAGAQARNEKIPSRANQAIHSNKTAKSARREARTQTSRSSQIVRGSRRSKRKSVDYAILGVHDEYSYEGNKFPSYKCSDGHRRISSPTMVEARTQQQTRAPANPIPVPAMGKTLSKRKLESESDCPPVSKKNKAAHPSNQATMSLPSGASVEPPMLSSLANQKATEVMADDFQLQNPTYHVQQQTNPYYTAAGITPAVVPDSAENNLSQPVQQTRAPAIVPGG
ncbi:hypothetical protein J3458_004174 [Metarhizium acridum]|uniref:uncharacterized protein n=1 Tax=Metarhizium acridum TaxID=92637 RepID=UPI001C6D279B|nr:hypothetical protein J3458_004174 [Metarhizium acridum]